MLKRHLIQVVVIAVLSVSAVVYMYTKNYIKFQAGVVTIGAFQPATKSAADTLNTLHESQPKPKKVAKVEIPKPSDVSTMPPRLFDDIMKATETFTPIITPFITYFLFTLKKKKSLPQNTQTT